MSESLNELSEFVSAKLAQEIIETTIENGELTIVVRRDTICKVLTTLRDDANCLFKLLMDVCGGGLSKP